jgi:hypothetical protein
MVDNFCIMKQKYGLVGSMGNLRGGFSAPVINQETGKNIVLLGWDSAKTNENRPSGASQESHLKNEVAEWPFSACPYRSMNHRR